jgi:hypothetical protein
MAVVAASIDRALIPTIAKSECINIWSDLDAHWRVTHGRRDYAKRDSLEML